MFVDINWEDLNWNMDQVFEEVTLRTRAVFSSPVLGNAYDLDRLVKFCKAKGIEIITTIVTVLVVSTRVSISTKHAAVGRILFFLSRHTTLVPSKVVWYRLTSKVL